MFGIDTIHLDSMQTSVTATQGKYTRDVDVLYCNRGHYIMVCAKHLGLSLLLHLPLHEIKRCVSFAQWTGTGHLLLGAGPTCHPSVGWGTSLGSCPVLWNNLNIWLCSAVSGLLLC